MLKRKEYIEKIKEEKALEWYEIIKGLPISIRNLKDFKETLNRFLNGTGDAVSVEFDTNQVTFYFSSVSLVGEKNTQAKSFKISNDGKGIIVISQIYDEILPVFATTTNVAYKPFAKEETGFVLKSKFASSIHGGIFNCRIGCKKEYYTDNDWDFHCQWVVTDENNINFEKIKSMVESDTQKELIDELAKVLRVLTISKQHTPNQPSLRPRP